MSAWKFSFVSARENNRDLRQPFRLTGAYTGQQVHDF
jgi:hypothetical protein